MDNVIVFPNKLLSVKNDSEIVKDAIESFLDLMQSQLDIDIIVSKNNEYIKLSKDAYGNFGFECEGFFLPISKELNEYIEEQLNLLEELLEET